MRRQRSEAGVSIVEAAFVIPIFFLFLLTTIDFAIWEFQISQANGAARDGARVGILNYQNADVTSSSDVTNINTAITKRLGTQTYSLVDINGTTTSHAYCVRPSTTTSLTNGCGPAIPGCDELMVRVKWTRTPFSPLGRLFGTETIHGEAEMTIVGAPGAAPTGTIDSTGCP